ncbi:hypothetical protein KGD82_16735 [Nocardiopsis eucommiae]|uniref:Uncharacterized protein n=1 Tax=Nocardiopsis eucommiae TaxID=2831970 RepID=A0A975L8C6_9ACTN|nr:hypothetical protein KGD82_16735 [Nocardiopsis eucommiae]
MGYDMTWENASQHEDPYFRLNIFGMARYSESMHRLGMLYPAEPGSFPQAHEHGTTWEHVWTVGDEAAPDPDADTPKLTEEQAEAARDFATRLETHLSQHPGDTPGIPSFKFSTNDGWLVTPEECKAAAQAARAATPTQLDANVGPEREYWGRWVEYLEKAAEHGGFRVN